MQIPEHLIILLQRYTKPSFKAWLFACSLFFASFFPALAHAYASLSSPAFSIEVVESGKTYFDSFTVYTVDLLGNRTSTTYGIKLKTASGSPTSSLSDVITSYSSSNFRISTSVVSGAHTFTTNGVTYYVTNSSGGALSATSNKNTASSLYVANRNNFGGAYGATSGTTSSISGDFIYNYSQFGSAIYVQGPGRVTNISGNFIGNYGNYGAIYNNSGTITNINANFIGNRATNGNGGAIYSQGTTSNVTGNFIGNTALASAAGRGGAIAQTSTGSMGTITGAFIGNSAYNEGGAVWMAGNVSSINADFIANSVTLGTGGAIYLYTGKTIGSMIGDFLSNKANSDGGAIYTEGTITTLNSIFTDNSSGNDGGAIANKGRLTNVTGGFYANSAVRNGGAIWNSGTIGTITGDFMSNTSGAYGGAIWNNGGTIGSISGSFMGNTAVNTGGAIYTSTDLTFNADGKTNSFSDNKDSSGYNSIYLSNNANLNFNMTNKGEFIINDSIVAAGNLTVDITGDSIGFGASTFYLNDMITTGGSLDINVSNANFYVGSYTHIDGTTTSGLGMTKGTITLDNADLILSLKGYSHGDSILDGVIIDNRNQDSDLWLYNVANGTYEFGNNNLSYGWTDDLVYTANSLQTVEIKDEQLIVGKVDTSGHFTGPLKDIIIEALDSTDFCASNASAGMDFICGATNVFVGDVASQQAVIESAAQMASIPGVNANTLLANRATRNAIKLRQIENTKEENAEVLVYDANGRLVYEDGEKPEYKESKGLAKWLAPENSITSSWFAPMSNHEDVTNMQAGIFNASYNSLFYGANVGLDRTFGKSFRLGLALGAGAGSTTAHGDFEGIENHFSFVTLNLYESLNVYDFTLNANLSYTRKFNNLTQDLEKYLMDSLYTSVDSYVWLIELYAEKDFRISSKNRILNNISFIPYLGLELIEVKTQNYNVLVDKSETNTSVGDVVFNVTTSPQNLAIIPLGLKLTKKIEKEFDNGENVWTFHPLLEAGAFFTFGDLYDKTITKIPDLKSFASFNLEIFEPITYNAAFGLDMSNDNFQIGFNCGIDFSENRVGQDLSVALTYNF